MLQYTGSDVLLVVYEGVMILELRRMADTTFLTGVVWQGQRTSAFKGLSLKSDITNIITQPFSDTSNRGLRILLHIIIFFLTKYIFGLYSHLQVFFN